MPYICRTCRFPSNGVAFKYLKLLASPTGFEPVLPP
jgi:hypothetical protein